MPASQGNSPLGGDVDARRSLRNRKTDDGQLSPAVDMASVWPAGWSENLTDSELLQAASSISPHVLRPGSSGLRSSSIPISHTNGHFSSPQRHHQHSDANINDHGSPTTVKFVNATVEILQNQIRKEEAPKKKRTRTTPDQLRILQKAFSADPMPNSSARLALAKRLGMNARAVQVWFQNRRAKEKLEAKRAEAGGNRDRSHSCPGHTPLQKDRTSEGAKLRPKGLRPNNGGGDDTTLYELGMYFGDQALAQYSAGFDFTSYAYPIDTLAGNNPVLFEEFVVGEHHVASGDATHLDTSPQQHYTRFQSMPTTTTAASCSHQYSVTAPNSANSLGLVFDPSASTTEETTRELLYQRSNSIDVLSIMGEAAALDAQGKIFATPAAREAFLTAPLGQSIPIPKQRSLSVPELPLQGSQGQAEIPLLFRNAGLLSIREEGAHDVTVKPPSSTVTAVSASLFPGMGGLDDIQAYLDGMSAGGV